MDCVHNQGCLITDSFIPLQVVSDCRKILWQHKYQSQHYTSALEKMLSLILDFSRCIQYEPDIMYMSDVNDVIATKKRQTVRFSHISTYTSFIWSSSRLNRQLLLFNSRKMVIQASDKTRKKGIPANEEGWELSTYAVAQPIQKWHLPRRLWTAINIKRVHQEEGDP